MNFLRLKKHLDKFLPLYVIIFMLLGFYTGLHVNVKKYGAMLKILNQIVVISMIYPMMINLRIEALKRASKSLKQLAIALVMGLVYAPLLMYGLAIISNVNNQLALGLLLAVVVPCSSMSIAYTGFTEGNLELATIIVAMSFTLAIITVPGWLSLFASQYNIPLPIWLLIKTIIIVVFIPLIFGYITRISLIKKAGVEKFEEIKPLFPSISLLGMYAIVFLIFMEKASLIAKKPDMVMSALLPLVLYYAITLLLFTFMNKKVGIPYEDHMAITFTSTGKNEGTAMAIAMAAGMGLMAIPPAITPLLQIPFLIGYVKLWKKIRKYWAIK
ncbi:MAG: arsenic resistance protein [Thermoplasmata archaeon]|nr:MAG: arsenic resistance protein [Thermoplasmata archaeon]MCD6171328.1 arsenic resistance protein [Thermoplasmata archaeon]